MHSRVYVSKKRIQRSAGFCTSAATSSYDNVYLTDEFTGKRFLVDTYAVRSILPSSDQDMRSVTPDHSVILTAANGSPIKSFSLRRLNLQFGGSTFFWSFLIAVVSEPTLAS